MGKSVVRRCHYIKPNHTSESPQRAIFIKLNMYEVSDYDNVKTYHWDIGYALLSTRSGKERTWKQTPAWFATSDAFWQLVDTWTRAKTKTYLVCLDSNRVLTLMQMFNQALNYGWTCSMAVIECPPCIVRWRKDKKTLLMWDMLNIWPTPSPATYNGVKMSDDSRTSVEIERSSVGQRLKQDVQDMFSTVTDWWSFLRTNDLGGFSPTIGAQSIRVWRHKYMTHPILIDCHDDALALARKGLYGGRVECGYIGSFNGTFHHLDINSSYAAAMRHLQVPIRLIGHTGRASIEDVIQWIRHGVAVADVTLRSDKPVFPVRESNRLLFPVGRFRTVLAGAELESAVSQGLVESVHECAVYEGLPAFNAYMTALWDNRLACKDSDQLADADKWKFLMAAFYGKWCQSGKTWEQVDTTDDDDMRSWTDIDMVDHVIHEYRQFGGVIQERMREKESSESHPAIAACVTASARQRLWQLMQQAGLENVFYVDTDSLLVNTMGFRRLYDEIDDRKLGGLKITGVYADIQIISAKHYRIGQELRVSGMSKERLVTDAGVVHQRTVQQFAAKIAGGFSRAFQTFTQKKTFTPKYDKGVVGPGGRVQPIQLELI